MNAYYNEIDPYAAQWLRNLIEAGHIAPGVVDERSIEDVRADELAGFAQCHFFAGIGIWSLALRNAGWPDDRPVWTGSCPCPPFSAAGKGSECPSCGGKSCLSHPLVTAGWVCLDCGDEWRGDDRHLLPEFIRLKGECRPPVVFGEQVASRDGRLWLYTLRAVMEAASYAVGAADMCAAGVGAPHIRQRLWFVEERLAHPGINGRSQDGVGFPEARDDGVVGNGASGGLVDSFQPGLERHPRNGDGSGQPGWVEADAQRPVAKAGCLGGMADAGGIERETGRRGTGREAPEGLEIRVDADGCGEQRWLSHAVGMPGPVNGFWRDADWLFCRDGKWRPVEPGTSPLADGGSSRVGRLRAYGNAIVAQAAQTFIEAYIDVKDAA